MINLVTTTDKLEVIQSAAATLNVHTSFVKLLSGAVTPGKKNTAITTTSAADITGSPASSEFWNVKTIIIKNKDTALPSNVTVRYNENSTIGELITLLMQPGDTLTFEEGLGWYLTTANTLSKLIKVLAADDTGGQAVNTVQPWFPTAGGVTLPGAMTYRMIGLLAITHGATTHTTGISFGGTATLTSITGWAESIRSAADTLTATLGRIHFSSASNFTVDVTGTQAATYLLVNGILRINAGGTFIPQFTFSANPTGTITIKKDSFFELSALGDNTLAAIGSWA